MIDLTSTLHIALVSDSKLVMVKRFQRGCCEHGAYISIVCSNFRGSRHGLRTSTSSNHALATRHNLNQKLTILAQGQVRQLDRNRTRHIYAGVLDWLNISSPRQCRADVPANQELSMRKDILVNNDPAL